MNESTNDHDPQHRGEIPRTVRTLSQMNAAGPWADQWAAVDMAMHILDEVSAAHARGAVGAVTPTSVVLDENGRVELLAANARSDSRYQTSESWTTGRTAPTDHVYAVGAMLYEMLAGHAPSGIDAVPAQSALRLRSDLNPGLAAVVARALAPQPSQRFASPAEFHEALDSLRVSLSGATELRRWTIEPVPGVVGTDGPALIRRPRWPLILTVLSLLVAAGLAVFWMSGRTSETASSDSVAVPSVAGMASAQAEQAITAEGLKPLTLQEPSVAVAVGSVIRSSPAAGTQVAKGSQVVVVVSGQAVSGTVPALVGLGQSEAQSILSQFGLTATMVQESSAALAGNVIRQSPEPGATAPAGSAVTLTVSSGPAQGSTTTTLPGTAPGPSPSSNVQVPSLVGQTYETATSMLTQAGLSVGSVSYQAAAQAVGTVISQNPAAGASVQSGSAVSVMVAE